MAIIELGEGRHVGVVPIDPQNTAQMDDDEKDRLVAELSSAIDTEIRDIPFRLFSTTRKPTAAADLAKRYRSRAFRDETTDTQEAVLTDVADWVEQDDAPNWDAREWLHYIIVDADSDDVGGYDVPAIRDMVSPFHEVERASAEDIQQVVGKRMKTARKAINSVQGLSARNATPAEALSLAREYWGRTDELSEELVADALAGEADMGRLIDPESWDPQNGWVDLGTEYAKAMWLAEYPGSVESLWLKHLTSLRGVDLDICLNATPEDSDEVVEALRSEIADVGSEAADRAEDLDMAAVDAEDANDVNKYLRTLFRDTDSQPWQLSTYVVVRADDKAALEAASEDAASFRDMDGARRGALEERAETVEKKLNRPPASTTPITPSTAQEKAFRAASPLTRDSWDEETAATKTKRVPGAVIGAAFPFASVSPFEADGMDWGRNEENGSLIRLSPFRRGGSPHILTMGQTRSGKTYSAGKTGARWYLDGDDRTYIAIDTQRGFEGITELCGGKHIVIDGTQTINPLRISADESDTRAQMNPFRMTVEETVSFVCNLLRSDGVQNPGDYSAMLSQAAARTLTNAGIERDDPSTFDAGQPHLGDMIDVLIDMQDDPTEYSWTDEEETPEVESQGDQIGELLTKLRSFKAEGRFASMVGDDELGIMDPAVDMVYLDLSSVGGSDDAEKSAMLQLMLSQVRKKIRHTPGECLVQLDEAHVLLDNPTTADWLQKATREFARFDTSLWFLSQSPKDFVSSDGETDARDVIRQQMGITQFFRTPGVDDGVLTQFGLNETQRKFVREEAVRGKSGSPEDAYSECLLNFADYEGWIPCYVESSPLEDRALTFNKGTGGLPTDAFARYMAGESLAGFKEDTDTHAETTQPATNGCLRDEQGRFV